MRSVFASKVDADSLAFHEPFLSMQSEVVFDRISPTPEEIRGAIAKLGPGRNSRPSRAKRTKSNSF